ncbi:hypothetical protein [Roseobacter sinensis]|uniref:Lipoprotein n=1 Tax=Roseobacter sinensis TaxID=2931391 RepID=A0ABT3BJB4_9RHOB|nr:hypothetical protein [Roseobacter sp. WL0113]MCV3273671.1 hypothetical protein [Roseobacter sp. WL0113]
MKPILSATALLLVLTACAPLSSPGATTERALARTSAQVAATATDAGIATDQTATVSASRADGGAAVFVPEAVGGGGFVGWLDLPPAHACRGTLPPANYAVSAEIGARSAALSLRQIDGPSGLAPVTVPVRRISSDAPVTPMARVALGPDSFLLGRWFTCSDGVGHCGYALTLDASTPGCGG